MRLASVMFGVMSALGGVALGQGGLIATKGVYDFGKRPQSDRFSGSFELVNTTSEPILIERVVPHCMCAKISEFPRRLLPEQKGVVRFEFATRQFEGQIAKVIEVRFGEGGVGRLMLTVQGDVVPAWRMEPSVIQLGVLAHGKTVRVKSVLNVVGKESFDFQLSPRTHGVTVSPKSIKAGTGEIPVTVTLAIGEGRRGAVVAEIAIKSTDPRKPEGDLQVLGFVEGDLRVTPRRLSFGSVKQGKDASIVVRLRSSSKRVFRVTGERTGGLVLGRGLRGEAGHSHTVTLTLQRGMGVGPVRGRYFLRTDHPEEAEIIFDFSARIVKP